MLKIGSGMNHTKRCTSERAGVLCALVALTSVVGAAACASKDLPESRNRKSPSSSTERGAIAGLSAFWSSADESIHDAQKSLRSARQAARQLGGEVARGDYDQIIALGHRLGGLGHDHTSPADDAPVVPMLDTMTVSIETLIQGAATSAELDEANRATEADVGKLSLRTQRLYHLLNAKKKVASVQSGAIAIGFRLAS